MSPRPRDSRGRFLPRSSPFQGPPVRAPRARHPTLWERVRSWFNPALVRGRWSPYA